MSQYQTQISSILENAERYHSAYYAAETFRGPSLYFHLRSLDTRLSSDFIRHLEYVYATLASWGMHRMGRGGSKMRAFDEFRESVQPLQKEILAAQAIDYRRMTAEDWRLLEEIFRAIKIMASGTSLVGNAKVMADMMPNIVPPIDREYTLRYLRGRTNMANDPSIEWALMKGIIADFFIPVATDPGFASSAERWMADPSAYAWDTSILKVIDNLVIGARK